MGRYWLIKTQGPISDGQAGHDKYSLAATFPMASGEMPVYAYVTMSQDHFCTSIDSKKTAYNRPFATTLFTQTQMSGIVGSVLSSLHKSLHLG